MAFNRAVLRSCTPRAIGRPIPRTSIRRFKSGIGSGELPSAQLKAVANRVRQTINDPLLNYRQRRQNLAAAAESMLAYPPLSFRAKQLLDSKVVCDLFEGPAPYRPRYSLPDYKQMLAGGCEYLELPPAQDLDEALSNLLIMYHHAPSITGHPVFIGTVDELLEPYASSVSDGELHKKLRLFWRSVDRTFPNAFCHANLGPAGTRVGSTILRVDRELKQTAPNLTLKVEPGVTPDWLLLDAIETCMQVAKPHFANHPRIASDLGDYGVVSCYNSLKVGGGAHSLVRLNLAATSAGFDGSVGTFLSDVLPAFVDGAGEVLAARIRYLVEEQRFFEHDFMAREGFLRLERFSAMFGVFALAELVNSLSALSRPGQASARYGLDADANALGEQILQSVSEQVASLDMPHCDGFGGRAMFHAQAGIDADQGCTPGARIPFDSEPKTLVEHIQAVAPMHRFFPAGVSDIFHLDQAARAHPDAVLRVLKGALASGMRDFTFDVADGEFVRVTGFLVRRADVAAFEEGGSRHCSDVFAVGQARNRGLLSRPSRGVDKFVAPSDVDLLDSRPRFGVDAHAGLVSKVIPQSAVDGPGSRAAVFLQGCNLACIHCHNPSTLSPCNACGVCVGACSHSALRVVDDAAAGRRIAWDQTKCESCYQCLAACPSSSDPHAQWRSPPALVSEVAAVADFIDGVTVTGGEPTQQLPFLRAFLKELKASEGTRHLTTAVDSNGVVDTSAWESLFPVMDGAFISIKAGSAAAYERIAGVPDAPPRVEASLRTLHRAEKLWEIRVVLIAGENDSSDEVALISEMCRRAAPGVPVVVVPFSPVGVRAEFAHLSAPDADTLSRSRESLTAHL